MSEETEDQKKYIYIDEHLILNNGNLAKINFLTFNENKNGAAEHTDLEFSVTIDDKHIVYNQTDGIKIEETFENIAAKQTALETEKQKLIEKQIEVYSKGNGEKEEEDEEDEEDEDGEEAAAPAPAEEATSEAAEEPEAAAAEEAPAEEAAAEEAGSSTSRSITKIIIMI